MITRARFQDYKLLREVAFPLGRLNVIVGKNGVGKSTVLEALHNLSRVVTARAVESVFSGPFSVSHLVSKPDGRRVRVEVELEDGRRFGIECRPATEGGGDLDAFDLWFGTPGGEDRLELPDPGAMNPRAFMNGPYGAKLGAAVKLGMNAEALSRAHAPEDESPRLEYDGTGLPSVLQYLQGLRDGVLEKIESDMRKVTPDLRRIRSLPSKISKRAPVKIAIDGQETWADQWREVVGTRFEVEWQGAGWVPAEQLSEGTLLALGMVTMLRFRPPHLVLLDDIDKALHPVAQRSLIDLLRGLLDEAPHVQLVTTSHSPFVLDALQETEVLVVGARDPGSSRIVRLDEHRSWKKRRQYMHPGEFWSMVGEGWVTEMAE